eukprot:SAG22_NODE_8406_length_659_cov_0.651786_2_plen_178_part_00
MMSVVMRTSSSSGSARRQHIQVTAFEPDALGRYLALCFIWYNVIVMYVGAPWPVALGSTTDCQPGAEVSCGAKPVLRVVVHGDERELFWQTVAAAAAIAARDYDTALEWRWPPPEHLQDPGPWMGEQIIDALEAGPGETRPSALIVTINSGTVETAVRTVHEQRLQKRPDRNRGAAW